MVIVATVLAGLRPERPFRPYLGPIPPLLGVIAAVILGLAGLTYLGRTTRLRIWVGRWNTSAVVIPALLALTLPLPAILIDLYLRFPRDLNVPPPLAFAFYPAIALVAEVVFHVLPLTALVFLLRFATRRALSEPALRFCLVGVALLEPGFQALLAGDQRLAILVSFQVLAVNLAAMWTYWRLDFVSLYAFRTTYYLLWHILWGAYRLTALFPSASGQA